MRSKYLLLIMLSLLSMFGNSSVAQWTTSGSDIYYSTGKVGIGTTSPTSGLSVESGVSTAIAPLSLVPNGSAWLGAQGSSGGISIGQNSGNYGYIQSRNKGTDKTPYKLALNPLGGNIGIGETSPASTLHVFESSAATGTSNGITIEQAGAGDAVLQFLLPSVRRWSIGIDNSDNASFKISSNAGLATSTAITIVTDGNVGIGTTAPTEKLSVKGKIRAQEIKVELTGWADHVFAKDYKLPTLKETEAHIKEKGHLPGIPSAAEVGKNGIELGEMNKKLLQKVEELTLHLIELNKENEQLITRVEKLENR